jgi:hypothetical protein
MKLLKERNKECEMCRCEGNNSALNFNQRFTVVFLMQRGT